MDIVELAHLLRNARKEQGLNQEQVASSAGLDRTTLSKLERGQLAEIGFSKVSRLAAVLGLELSLKPLVQRPTLDDLVEEQERRE